jgi:hypothetical protein
MNESPERGDEMANKTNPRNIKLDGTDYSIGFGTGDDGDEMEYLMDALRRLRDEPTICQLENVSFWCRAVANSAATIAWASTKHFVEHEKKAKEDVNGSENEKAIS